MTWKYWTPPAIGKLLGVDPARVIGWIRAGKLAAINLSEGKRPRYRVSDEAIDDFLRQRQVLAAPKRTWTRRKKYKWFADDSQEECDADVRVESGTKEKR